MTTAHASASSRTVTTLHRFALDDIAPEPWRNGLGVTREIVSWPRHPTGDAFDWRISAATLAASGAFSRFPGIDRSFTLLDGDGVRLRSADGTIDQYLEPAQAPYAFDGDTQLHCQLAAGPCTAFNAMVRRGRAAIAMDWIRQATSIDASGAASLILAVTGRWRVSGQSAGPVEFGPRTGVWWSYADPSNASISIEPCGTTPLDTADLEAPRLLSVRISGISNPPVYPAGTGALAQASR